MATVTGKTSAKLDELLGLGVVGGAIDPAGQLTLQTKNGQTLNAGSVGTAIVSGAINEQGRLILTARNGSTVDAGPVQPKPIASWPVGSIFMATVSTNPNTLLGGGTWVAWGQGRVPVSVDSSQAEFDAVEELGGSKTKAIGPSNLPSHKHTINHSHTKTTIQVRYVANTTQSGTGTRLTDIAEITGGGGTLGQMDVTMPAYNGESGDGPGTSEPLNVLQPYITCYMWKRTA